MLTREQSIKATFDIFKDNPDAVIEVRALEKYTYSGYYKDKEKLIKDLSKHDDKTWYFVMNEIDEACFSRSQSEKIISDKKIVTTSDKDIKRLNWFLIDSDPERASKVSATDAEKELAREMCRHIYSYLRNVGFSAPIVCDSGNGYHLLYKINLSTENSTIVKKFLQSVSMLFSSDKVKVDTSVFNPARITKVYGTIARKGADTADRPHRASGIISIPDSIELTSKSLIEKVANLLPEPEKPSYKNGYSNSASSFNIDDFISKTGLQVRNETNSNGIRKIVLENCPFDSNHKAPDSAIFVLANGAIAFKCFHNSCSDKTWQDVRKMFDRSCYQKSQEQSRTHQNQREQSKNIEEKPIDGKILAPAFLRLCDIEVLDRSKIVSIKTGFTELDKKIIGTNKGEFSIWSGGNGSGKSTILSQISLNSASIGFNTAMFSGELTSNRMKNWLLLQAAGRQNTKLSDNGVSYYVPKKTIKKIDDWVSDKLWIYNNDYGTKVEMVLKALIEHIKNHHTDVIVIDNLMSLDIASMTGDKYDKQTALALKLSYLAKKLNVHIHFVCHPRKPNGFLRKADISGTADLTNAADNIFMMHRVNSDFMKLGGEFLGKDKVKKYENFNNVIEVMKNRDLGVEDEIIGLYFEPQSKRMLNEKFENKLYGWEDDLPVFGKVEEEGAPPF